MRNRSLVIFLVLTMLLSSTALAFAQDAGPVEPLSPAPSAENGEMTNETPQLWFVELSSAPTADGGSLTATQADKASFHKEARNVKLQYKERFAFDSLWNGISMSVPVSQIGKLSRMSTVKAIYPVLQAYLPPTTEVADPELATALAMTGADIAQSELGYTGKGVKVAVMDTGIDYNHPDLGGCFGSGCRVYTGWDFVGDAYNADPTAATYNPVPTPDPDPDDCAGHGTHVSGIIGANGTVKGVAPDVKFGAYRVFGCAGSTESDIMLAAMERALADGMQVLNMSIGSAFMTWPQYPTAAASDRLVNKGMVVVASIGNSGANGLYSAGAPGVGKKVIGVASFDNTRISQAAFAVSPDGKLIGYNLAAGAPPPPLSGSLVMAKTGTQTTVNDACNLLPAGSLAGKAVLIRRGTCTFYVKATNAQNAGAAAVVLYNNVAGALNPTVAGIPPITIPVVAITAADGALIDGRIAAGATELTWTNQTVSGVVPTAGLISSFSSYGLTAELDVKPDLGAPGGYIWSTYPLEKGGYTNLSGTSMASPHVAGAVALLLQARPKTPAQTVDVLLQNSADPAKWWGNPGLGFLDNVHRQGAGMLDIDDAILATTKIEPSQIATGESQAGPYMQKLIIENKADGPITYDLSFQAALSTGPSTFVPSFSTSDTSVAFSAPSVTVPAGGTASVTATITPATGPDRAQYGGYIVFTPQGGGQIYRVPYAGFVGDYQSIQVLAPTPYGFPFLTRVAPGTCTRVDGKECIGSFAVYSPPIANTTFSMTDVYNVPVFATHFDHPARRFRMEIFAAGTNKPWHRAFDVEYLARNSTNTSWFGWFFDGVTKSGNKLYTLPDGAYYAKISVLKALGSDSNPTDWESWTSPVFTIDRPE